MLRFGFARLVCRKKNPGNESESEPESSDSESWEKSEDRHGNEDVSASTMALSSPLIPSLQELWCEDRMKWRYAKTEVRSNAARSRDVARDGLEWCVVTGSGDPTPLIITSEGLLNPPRTW